MQAECANERCEDHNCDTCAKKDAPIDDLECCEGCAVVCRWVSGEVTNEA